MNLSENSVKLLKELGVGLRLPQDDFFKSNEILSNMTERFSVFDIDIGKYSDSTATFKCHVPGCSILFDCLIEYESHYNTAHKYRCCECKMSLPSPHLLDLHVAETHDSFFAAQAERGPAYVCYVETCKFKFLNPEERMKHCVKDHKYPVNFRFDHKVVKKWKKTGKKDGENEMEINSESSDRSQITEEIKTVGSKLKTFSFGHSRQKVFHQQNDTVKNCDTKSVLEDENMLLELKENLPK